MAKKLSFLEVVCVALLVNVMHWHVTSSFTVGPHSSTGIDETTDAADPNGLVIPGLLCVNFNCPPNKKCVMNPWTNLPECECLDACALPSNEVCGTDGQTYDNGCLLDLQACKTDVVISILHQGSCKAETTPNGQGTYTGPIVPEETTTDGPGGIVIPGLLCVNFNCPLNKKCVVNPSTNLPECTCLDACALPTNEVCGSDGQTYDNGCLLDLQACKTDVVISVLHQGSCKAATTTNPPIVTEETTTARVPDLCDEYPCPANKHCEVNAKTNRPECVCNEICFDLFAPVCGSDGRNYSNECFLGVEACRTDTVITVQHEGNCNEEPTTTVPTQETTLTTGPDVCDEYPCPADKYCVVNETTNRPECVCNEICFMLYDPVCGSDGNDYGNECFLQVAACQANTVITVQHQGSCNDVPSSTVPIETTVTDETGTTGQGCAEIECPFYGKCVPDGRNRPRCVCVLACNRIYRPVCGSNIITYANECELRRAACEASTTITVLRTGRCEDEEVTATTPSAKTTTKRRKCRRGRHGKHGKHGKHGRRYNNYGV